MVFCKVASSCMVLQPQNPIFRFQWKWTKWGMLLPGQHSSFAGGRDVPRKPQKKTALSCVCLHPRAFRGNPRCKVSPRLWKGPWSNHYIIRRKIWAVTQPLRRYYWAWQRIFGSIQYWSRLRNPNAHRLWLYRYRRCRKICSFFNCCWGGGIRKRRWNPGVPHFPWHVSSSYCKRFKYLREVDKKSYIRYYAGANWTKIRRFYPKPWHSRKLPRTTRLGRRYNRVW